MTSASLHTQNIFITTVAICCEFGSMCFSLQEHPHESTSPSSIQFSSFPHSSPLTVSDLIKSVCNYFSVFPHSSSLSLSLSLSNTSLCSVLLNHTLLPSAAKCSLPPSIFVSHHSSQGILKERHILGQAKVLTGGGDLREAQVDVPLSVSHICV